MFTFTLSSYVLGRVYLCSLLFTKGALTKDNGPKNMKQGLSGNIAHARNVFFLFLFPLFPCDPFNRFLPHELEKQKYKYLWAQISDFQCHSLSIGPYGALHFQPVLRVLAAVRDFLTAGGQQE